MNRSDILGSMIFTVLHEFSLKHINNLWLNSVFRVLHSCHETEGKSVKHALSNIKRTRRKKRRRHYIYIYMWVMASIYFSAVIRSRALKLLRKWYFLHLAMPHFNLLKHKWNLQATGMLLIPFLDGKGKWKHVRDLFYNTYVMPPRNIYADHVRSMYTELSTL